MNQDQTRLPSNPGGPAPEYRCVARGDRVATTEVRVGDAVVGGRELLVIAGPCAVESGDQIERVASHVAALGVPVLRGGAFKPRTSPYSFQGLGMDGYRLLRDAARAHGLLVVSEVLSESHVEAAVEYVDAVQVGSRNMQNFSLLKELGRCGRPVLLKRGMSATCDELLCAAEYIVSSGNPDVVLCERGIRTFETSTRNSLDISAVPVLRRKSHLPVIVDPSHAAGRADLVPDLARAAVAVGADGVMLEVHPAPEDARSDREQALRPSELEELLQSLARVAEAVGRALPLAARTSRAGRAVASPRC